MTPTHAFCSGCVAIEPVDANWRALWIDPDGGLKITDPERGCDLDYERPNTVFACGQGSALALTERYLQSAGFSLAKPPQSQPGYTGEELNRFAHA